MQDSGILRLDIAISIAPPPITGGEVHTGCVACPLDDVATLVATAAVLDPALWERRPDNADFLCLRVGWGDRRSGVSVAVPPGGDPDLRLEASAVVERHRVLHSAPLVVSLPEVGNVGLSGPRPQVKALARSLLLQVAILHSPGEVLIAAAVPDQDRAEWSWLHWLPHAGSRVSPLEVPLLAGRPTAAAALVHELRELVKKRASASHSGAPESASPVIVVALDEAAGLSRSDVSELMAGGPSHGVYTIWTGSRVHDLPGACRALVDLEPGSFEARVIRPDLGEEDRGFCADQVQADVALESSLALAWVRDAGARAGESVIPDRVGLLEVLGLEGEEVLEGWWRRDDGFLGAPVGIGAGHSSLPVVESNARTRLSAAPPTPGRASSSGRSWPRWRRTTRRGGSTSSSSTTRVAPPSRSASTCLTPSAS